MELAQASSDESDLAQEQRFVEKNPREEATSNERNESSKSNSIIKTIMKVVGFILLMFLISLVTKFIWIGGRELGF